MLTTAEIGVFEALLCVLALTATVGATINLRRNRWHRYVTPDFDHGHPAQIGDLETAEVH